MVRPNCDRSVQGGGGQSPSCTNLHYVSPISQDFKFLDVVPTHHGDAAQSIPDMFVNKFIREVCDLANLNPKSSTLNPKPTHATSFISRVKRDALSGWIPGPPPPAFIAYALSPPARTLRTPVTRHPCRLRRIIRLGPRACHVRIPRRRSRRGSPAERRRLQWRAL